jgi:hypothetical protein
VLGAFGRYKGGLHDADRHGILLAVLAALVAQDLELAKKLLQVRKSDFPSHPRQFALFKQVVNQAVEEEIAGERFLRITEDAVIRDFFSLFNIHRLPLDKGRADVMGEFKRLEFPLAPAPLGNYLFAWFYLQSIAEPPANQVSWDKLREIMTA